MMPAGPKPPPWKTKRKQSGPKKPASKMTPEQIERARQRAQEAGRPYPNLIDNMAIIKQDRR